MSKVDVTRRVAHFGRLPFQFWHLRMHREERRFFTYRPQHFLPSSIVLEDVPGNAATLGWWDPQARKTYLPSLADGAFKDERARSEAWSSVLSALAGSSAVLGGSAREPWCSVLSGRHGPKSSTRRLGGETGLVGRRHDRSPRDTLGGMPMQAWWIVPSPMEDRRAKGRVPAVQARACAKPRGAPLFVFY